MELRQFIERLERLNAEKKDLAALFKDVMDEAKSAGYDTKAIREVLRIRAMDPNDLAEFESVVDLYRGSLGS